MALDARQALLELRDLEEVAKVDEARKLADERDVLRHVGAELAELGVLVDEAVRASALSISAASTTRANRLKRSERHAPLHVCNSLNLARNRAGRAGRVVLHIRREVCTQVAKVVIQIRGKERVLFW